MDTVLGENTPLLVADRQDTPAVHREITAATHPILIINDDPTMLKALACTLEDAGYTVVAVTSGCEALQWIQAAGAVGELPALILLDLALADVCRAQVAEALHQLVGGRIAPIIVFCAADTHHLQVIGRSHALLPMTAFVRLKKKRYV